MSTDVLNRWLNEDEDFAAAVAEAENEAHVRNVAVIQKAAAGYDVVTTITTTKRVDGVEIVETKETKGREFCWQAAAWYLERKHPDEWRKQDKMELEHSGGIDGSVVSVIERVYGKDTAPDSGGVLLDE